MLNQDQMQAIKAPFPQEAFSTETLANSDNAVSIEPLIWALGMA